MGKVLMEEDPDVDMRLFTYIYAGDQRIAMYDKNENLHFYLNDHLGSARVVIDSTGTVKDKYKRYYAFGAPDAQTVSTDQYSRSKPLSHWLTGTRFRHRHTGPKPDRVAE